MLYVSTFLDPHGYEIERVCANTHGYWIVNLLTLKIAGLLVLNYYYL